MSRDDESVVLPKAVQEQISAADEIYNAIYNPEDGEKPEEGTEPEVAQKPEETPEPEPEVAQQPEQKPEPQPEEDSFEHKFKVLKGKYDKEVPRLHRQLRDLTNENSRLKERGARLEAEVKRLNEKPEPKEPALTQEEIDQFGPDLIDIIRRVAKEETGVVLDKNLKQVKEKVDDADDGVSESDRRQMLADLADAVPGWEKQNEDEDFLAWLDQNDPMSGRVRMEMLAEAYKKCDAPRLIAIFKGFQKENAVVTPDDEPSDETPAESKKPEQPLEDLVAPGTPKTGSAGAQNESGKKVWTQTEIQEFYTYKNEFIKKNPEKELPEKVIQLERDLFKAQSEGRIR